MKNKLLLIAILALSAGGAWAQTVTSSATVDQVIPDFVSTEAVNNVMPDFNLTGLASTINLNSTGINSITGVTLTLDVSGYPSAGDAFNGDYYAYLTHGSGISILLNRVGVTAVNSLGYSDSGFDITLSAGGSNIHDYQAASYTLNGDGQLIGAWGPDGRSVSPFTVTDATPPTALLNVFNGQSADGGWTLFIADASAGGVGELDDWSLSVTGAVSRVPDGGSTWALLLLAGLALLLLRRQRKILE